MVSGITVKVCGVTQPEQASEMIFLGVDYIGVNFVPSSPRRISPERAADIVRAAGGPSRVVGVFQDPEASLVERCIETAGIGCLQFHGSESLPFCESFGLPFIRVIAMDSQFDAKSLQTGKADWLLFDARKGTQRGGTGQAFDWNLLAGQHIPIPWFLAGGLGPTNIFAAIQTLRPNGVDLNSRIETEHPGFKDLAALRLCIAKITEASEAK